MNLTLRWILYSCKYLHIHYIYIYFTSELPLCCILLSRTLILTGTAQLSSAPPHPRLSAALLPLIPRSQSHSALSTSVLSQSQPPPNIPAYHVALDGFVLRSIGVECLTKHSRIEEAIYNCGRKPRISQNETYGRGVLWVERSSDGE